MPHQCTECGRAFPDGSKEMLSGCPDCGGNKFQFRPAGDADDPSESETASPDPPSRGGVADRVGRATATVKRWVSGGDDGGPAREESASDLPDSAGTSSGNGAGLDAPDERPPSDPSDPSTAGADVSPESGGSSAVAGGSSGTGASSSSPGDATSSEGDDDRGYGEWPNPDGVDTAGVGKGPEARRTRSSSDDGAGEGPDDTDGTHHTDDTDGTHHTDDTDGTHHTDDRDDSAPTDTDDGERIPDDDGVQPPADDSEDSAQANARSDVVSRDELPESPPDSGTLGPRQPTGSDDRPRPETGASSPERSGTRSTEGPDDRVGADDRAEPDDTPAEQARPTDDGEAPPETPEGRVASEPSTDDRPDLNDLREELNDQFESIKILEPGQYELNLMELYDREEYIISLQEDGRYVIEVPERWRDEDD